MLGGDCKVIGIDLPIKDIYQSHKFTIYRRLATQISILQCLKIITVRFDRRKKQMTPAITI